MELKDAFKELSRFAAARSRGAVVVLGNGRLIDGTGGFTGTGVDANTFMSHTIAKIIEPTVLRDWTAEDAKKHVGFAWRHSEGFGIIGAKNHSGKPWNESDYRGPFKGCSYAAPIPGTDPSKWDWKPCKVGVPAEKAKTDSVAIASIRNALAAMATCQDWRKLNRPIIMGWINDALFSLESP